MTKRKYPLYRKYPGQLKPQDAYLEIREDGTILCESNPEIGNGVPVRVWHGLDKRFSVSPYLSAQQIRWLIAQVRPHAQKYLNETEIVWDGSNHVRRSILGNRVSRLESEIIRICELTDDRAANDIED